MFVQTVRCLNRLVALSLSRIEAAVATGERDAIAIAASTATRDIQKLMDVTSAIINGTKPTINQQEIDALLQASSPPAPARPLSAASADANSA